MTPDGVPSVPAAAVPEDGVLLDVREDDEWTAGHAPQAVHVPMGAVPQRIGEIPDEGTVHVICRSGGRSAQVTAYLNQSGRQAVNVDGGMRAWAATGRPMAAGSGRPPQVI
ncbi:MAG TPA: rhodanese-like domain-containing protein [Pseudonocardiaceae bacterium]|nr:rhodanese-like domain-containing protein [Pseudonocardiaceae bacterium]